MTANVKSYRAPEILMQDFDEISYPVDVFAAGCLFAEIILGKPLFRAKYYIEQLEMIAKLIGIPEILDLKAASDMAIKWVHRIHTSNLYKQDTFAETFPSLKEFPDALDLLKKMLAFKPKDRISVKEAIQHSFFDHIRSKYFVTCGDASSFRHTGFNVDTCFESVLLIKNLIYNELFLGRELESTISESIEQVNQYMQEFSDLEIITTSSDSIKTCRHQFGVQQKK
jgi:serine/threonine protein kinase